MAQLSEIAKLSSGSGNSAGTITRARLNRVGNLAPLNIYATMQGQRVATEHLAVIAGITMPMVQSMTLQFGGAIAETARFIHFPNIDTRETFDSIRVSSFVEIPGGARVEVSVSTEQARFLEFGFVHHISGQWIQNAFMIPAADLIVPVFIDAINQVAQLGLNRRFFSGDASRTAAAGMLGGARKFLYSYSKFAGDIQVLGIGGLSKSRGLALKGARGIGNIQAAQGGTLISRIGRVMVGQNLGKYGRSGFVSGFGTSTLQGPAARIYNRIAGRAFGGALSEISFGDF